MGKAVMLRKLRQNGKGTYKAAEEGDLLKLRRSSTDYINCILFFEDTGMYGEREINRNLIPSDSVERKYKGEPVHLLTLDTEGKLHAVEPLNEIGINDSPQDLFMALQFESEVNEVYGMSESLLEKIKLGIFFALCFFLLIILFFISVIAMGGGTINA